MEITRHAKNRGMERFGWDYARLKEKAELSLTDGMYVFFDDVLAQILHHNKTKCSLLYYREGVVFVFDGPVLITVYSINNREVYL